MADTPDIQWHQPPKLPMYRAYGLQSGMVSTHEWAAVVYRTAAGHWAANIVVIGENAFTVSGESFRTVNQAQGWVGAWVGNISDIL